MNVMNNLANSRARLRRSLFVAAAVAGATVACTASAQTAGVQLGFAVLSEFTSVCGEAVTDPAGFVAGSTALPNMAHVSSPDGSILSLSYTRPPTGVLPSEVYGTVEIAAVAPDTWVVTCNVGAFDNALTADEATAAFQAAVDATPGLHRVGGYLPFLRSGGTTDGEATDIPHSLFVVTGWSSSDPNRHIWAEMLEGGFDIWTQLHVKKSD